MVGAVVELGDVPQLSRIQGPHNERTPSAKFIPTTLSAASLLEILGCKDAMLSVNDHEVSIHDLFPLLRLLSQKLIIFANGREANLLSLLHVDHLNELFLDIFENVLLQSSNDVLVIREDALIAMVSLPCPAKSTLGALPRKFSEAGQTSQTLECFLLKLEARLTLLSELNQNFQQQQLHREGFSFAYGLTLLLL